MPYYDREEVILTKLNQGGIHDSNTNSIIYEAEVQGISRKRGRHPFVF